jgi:endonuclease YncB( thermonuclease family)
MPFGRRVGVTAIVVGSLFVVGSALGDGGDPDAKSSDTPTSASTPHPKASSTPTPAGDKAATPASTPKPAPKPKPKPKPKPATYVVTHVVDGDTVDLGNGQTVRLVGIDTPERGECGYERASDNLARLVLGKQVRLGISDEDTDRYGRLLRYVDVGAVDAGLAQIKGGYAIARYDSRDGYGFHPREPVYVKADRGSKPLTCAKPAPQPLVGGGGAHCMTGYAPCLPVVADLDCGDIDGPVRVTGSDPYRLDADGDGIGCDS